MTDNFDRDEYFRYLGLFYDALSDADDGPRVDGERSLVDDSIREMLRGPVVSLAQYRSAVNQRQRND
jgi:hypothetical protein